eukprot:3682290-Prymnesium_polylepis.1
MDANSGVPTHMVSGVSTSLDGIRWGDGWTAVQQINPGETATASECADGGACCAQSCSETQQGLNGACYECPMPPNCAEIVASPARDTCMC